MIEILGIRAGLMLRQPFGQCFEQSLNGHEGIFYQSGDTKTRSAAACQFAIDRWQPDRIINLGTCGGVGKEIGKLDLIMAEKTVQYDCIIRFGEPQGLFYKPMITTIDTSWVDVSEVAVKIHKGILATADQDLNAEWKERLQKEDVLGADWESGAIAKVCELNRVKCLILRGVTDLPDGTQGSDFEKNTPIVMASLLTTLTQMRFL
jgi:nucleoside phosphorylase